MRGETPVRHAFDGSGVCVVPLTLSLRNCLPQTASLSVEAGLTVEAAQRDGAALWQPVVFYLRSYPSS